jgi:hypothetical protein
MIGRPHVFTLLAVLIVNAPASAQPESNSTATERPVQILVAAQGVLQRIELLDGSVMYGRVVSFDGDVAVFQPTLGGQVQLRREAIARLETVRGRMRNGVFEPGLEPATRLFFAPTARPLHPREGAFGVYEFLLPFVQVGVTDWFSIGGGTPLVFEGSGSQPVWVTPKFTIYSRNDRSVAAGVFHIFGVERGVGVAYGVTTIGPPDGALTAGLGYAYAGRSRALVVMLGGEKQVSRRIQFITENWIWKGGRGIVSAGVRFNRDHLSADVGLGVPIGVEESFAFPMVNFCYRF